VAKERISKDEADQARQRLTSTTNIEDLKDVDFVIEAVPVRQVFCVYQLLTGKGNPRAEVQDFCTTCKDMSCAHHSGDQYIVNIHYKDCGSDYYESH
jgi:3-hydroxyacyl-CoA dehydrogenase, NAD binding domain